MERSVSATGMLPCITTTYSALTTAFLMHNYHDCPVPAAIIGDVILVAQPQLQHMHKRYFVICP